MISKHVWLSLAIGLVFLMGQGANAWAAQSLIESVTSVDNDAAAGVPVIHAPYADEAPQIDGQLDDAAWQQAAPLNLMTRYSDQATPRYKTSALVCFDDDNLYLSMICQEPALDHRVDTSDGVRDQWAGDVLEIFLDPQRTRAGAYHFAFNSAASQYDAAPGKNAQWQADWQVATTDDQKNQRWMAEVRIPLNSITSDDRPIKGQLWGFNLGRERINELSITAPELSIWRHTGLSFHNADRYGILYFGSSEQRRKDQQQPVFLMDAQTSRITEDQPTIDMTLAIDRGEPSTYSAQVKVMQQGREVRTGDIAHLQAESTQVRLNLAGLSAGAYEIIGALRRDGQTVAEQTMSVRMAEGSSATIVNPQTNPVMPAVASQRVPLRIDLPQGLDQQRPSTRASQGYSTTMQGTVPFQRGVLRDIAHVRLLDKTGQEHPCQLRTLTTWDQGQSIKWLEVLFVADDASQDGWQLEFGRKVSRRQTKSALRVGESHRGIVIDNGVIHLRIDRDTGHLLSELRHTNGNPILTEPLVGQVTDQHGQIYTTGTHQRAIDVEEDGPIRSVARITGWYQSDKSDGERPLNRYVARVYVWANQPTIRVQYTFINTGHAQNYRYRAIRVSSATAIPEHVTFYADTDSYTNADADHPDARDLRFTENQLSPIVAVQAQSNTAHITPSEGEAVTLPRLGNTMSLGNDQQQLITSVRWLWQQHPAGFEVDKTGRFRIDLWSPHADKIFDLRQAEYVKNIGPRAYDLMRRQSVGFPRKHELLPEDGGTRQASGIGMGKTHELYFTAVPTADAAPLARRSALLADHPVYLTAEPESAVATGVRGLVHAVDRQRFPQVEKMVDDMVGGFYTMRKWDHGFGDGYGFFNFGDSPGRDANYFHRYWTHLFYLSPSSYWQLFFRSSDRATYELALANARHCSDIDTGHHTPDPNGTPKPDARERAGGVNTDDAGLFHHFASYHGNGYTAEPIQTNNYGMYLCLAYEMTGDRRIRDVIDEVTEAMLWGWQAHGGAHGWQHRSNGNAFANYVYLYGVTWDKRIEVPMEYLRKQMLENVTDDGANIGNNDAIADFTTAYMVPGATEYHRMTADPQVAQWIVANADYMSRYTGVGPWDHFAKWGGPAYAYQLTGKTYFVSAIKSDLDKMLAEYTPTAWMVKSYPLFHMGTTLAAIAAVDASELNPPTWGLTTSDMLVHDDDDRPMTLDVVVWGPRPLNSIDADHLPALELVDPNGQVVDRRPYPDTVLKQRYAVGGWAERFAVHGDKATGVYQVRLTGMPVISLDNDIPFQHDGDPLPAWIEVRSYTQHKMASRVQPDGLSPGGRYADSDYELYVPADAKQIKIRVRASRYPHEAGDAITLTTAQGDLIAQTPITASPLRGEIEWYELSTPVNSLIADTVIKLHLPKFGEIRPVVIEGVPPYLAVDGQGFKLP